MDGYKEFKGKTLDNAIEEACSYFNSPREKLEIELINDAKTGIFGLVGAKKAKIRARRMQVQFDSQTLSAPIESSRRSKKNAAPATAEPEAERKTEKPKQKQERPKRSEKPQSAKPNKAKEKTQKAPSEEAQSSKPKQERGRNQRSKPEGTRGKKQPAKPSEKPQGAKPARKKQTEAGEEKQEGQKRGRNQQQRRRPQNQRGPKQDQPQRKPRSPRPEPAIEPVQADPIPEANLEELDQAELLKVVTEVVNRLITPVIGETPVEARIEDGRVKASINSGDNSGLLIGREGQTLASFQYLANRIVAKIFGVAVRVQLDTGDYRERQDEKLRDIALHLAEKAKTMGKPQSTRPLSSYHRRVVHLALQDDDDIQTRSKGDGPLKRVIIGRKRK